MATGNYSLQLPADGGAPMDGQAVVAPQGYQQYTTGKTRSRTSFPARGSGFLESYELTGKHSSSRRQQQQLQPPRRAAERGQLHHR